MKRVIWSDVFIEDVDQGLIHKENVDIDVEKSSQISIVAKKAAIQKWLQIMIMGPKQATHYN